MSNEPESAIQLGLRMSNGRGQTYFVKVWTNYPAALVRGLWQHTNKNMQDYADEYFMGELTERAKMFRTSVQRNYTCPSADWEVCIRTHARSPSQDTNELYHGVLAYLRGIGLEV